MGLTSSSVAILLETGEKFEDLCAKVCNFLELNFCYWEGPQCVLSCAKEYRPLPQQDFTCYLAMDGVKILASGYQADEKLRC